MVKSGRQLFIFWFLHFSLSAAQLSEPKTAPKEVEALRQIAKTLGKQGWNFGVDPCKKESSWVERNTDDYSKNEVNCSCSNTVCHVRSIVLKRQNLSGVLPRELVEFQYLEEIDLSRNYLNGTIPVEWASMNLRIISLLGNRLSGRIPSELVDLTTLEALVLEANQFSGNLPSKLGQLVNLKRLLLSSNSFSGELPNSLAKLTSLTDFRISDNQFSGKLPDFIQNWPHLEILAIQASGLQGQIPSSIASLINLTDLRISDINGTSSAFPPLNNMTRMRTLILRNCNLNGSIPENIGKMMPDVKTLDLSFNKLEGQITSSFPSKIKSLDYLYLTSNKLNGSVPDWMLKKGKIDLSYNDFSVADPQMCQQGNGNVNQFGSSTSIQNSSETVPCLKDWKCPKYVCNFHINCGGNEVNYEGTTFTRDSESGDVASNFVRGAGFNWEFSSTGHFLNGEDENHIASNKSMLLMPDSGLYKEARLSPLSLTYYGRCLKNGNYTVKLHFAEIMFTDNRDYTSLGRRIFNIYVQGVLVRKDFNIEKAAGGTHRPTFVESPAIVKTNTLEIRFYWAGKGTTALPSRSTYGPLISAISVVDPNCRDSKKLSVGAVVGIVLAVLGLVFFIVGILWWRGCFGRQANLHGDLIGLDLQTGSFTLRQIKAATNNFDDANKIGEGGFGPVYRGVLFDGTMIAVKQLSSKSKQGNREFVNEIGMISALQHPNLVRLYGCCIEGNQLLLVYEYMENNSLARALFGSEEQQISLDWPTRHKICVGIARGLAYLHEESRLKIVHRDIKATNVLLDKDLNPKISDFGLAKLDEEENTHISTRIAGTMGYMAPEYAMHGYLTDKADVYSFGIVALEIVSGKSNMNYRPKEDRVHLLDWAYVQQDRGTLIDLVDPKLGSNFNEEEAMRMLTVALMCTNSTSELRPCMSAVVSMLEGRNDIQHLLADPNLSSSNLKAMALRHRLIHGQEQSQSQSISIDGPSVGSSTSAHDLYPINVDSAYWNGRE